MLRRTLDLMWETWTLINQMSEMTYSGALKYAFMLNIGLQSMCQEKTVSAFKRLQPNAEKWVTRKNEFGGDFSCIRYFKENLRAMAAERLPL